MKNSVIRSVRGMLAVLVLILIAACIAIPQPKPVPPLNPTFEKNVYGIAVYGDFSAIFRVNSDRWYATADTANALAARYNAVPILNGDSPQTGPAPRGWLFVEVPDSLMNLAMKLENRTGAVKEKELAPLLGLPRTSMWVLKFRNGCVINAGYLAGYFVRNPEALFPGLAERYVKQIIAGECGQ